MKSNFIFKNDGFMPNNLFLKNDMKTILRMGKALKMLYILEATLTVGIIAFTVLRIINIFRKTN